MSDAPPTPEGAALDPAAELAKLQQRALEQDLRIADLERTIDHLAGERAALIERERVLRAHTGIEGAAREVKRRVQGRVRDLRSGPPAPVVPAVPLSSLPVSLDSAVPRWQVDADVLADVRPAIVASPPCAWSWDLDLVAGCTVRGSVALRPGAWETNHGGVDLVVELLGPPAGTEGDGNGDGVRPHVTSFVLSVDPAARAGDRAWLPWRLPLGAASGPHRLVISFRIPDGASPDYAWALLGEPGLEVPGLAPRAPLSDGAPSSNGTGAVGRTAPTIGLLLPVHDPEPGLLDRTLASVTGQTSGAWELCIVDDGSTDPLVRDRLARAVADDPRVRLHRHETAQGISGATNAALKLTKAEFVATLDHDDVLAPDAIAVMGGAIAGDRNLAFAYSDNDILAGDSRRFSASLKPDWSPDLMRACMYTLHFSVYRRSLVEQIGGWRTEFDGAQDHDLVLRLVELIGDEGWGRIKHVPRVLYHWRAHAGSAALGELAKPQAYERGRLAVAEHVERSGHVGATVERLPQAGRYRVKYARTKPVQLLIPVRGQGPEAGLRDAVAELVGLLRADDVIHLVASTGRNESIARGRAADIVDELRDPRLHVTVNPYDDHRDSTMIAFAHAVTPDSDDVIDELAGLVEAGARAAGGVVADRRGRLVAGGVAFPRGLPVPLNPDADLSADDRHPALTMVSNCAALRGVVAFPTTTAPGQQPGTLGLATESVWELMFGRNVWSPHAQFTATDEVAADFLRWPLAEALELDRGALPDPYWNPLRWPDRGDATVPESVHQNPLLDLPDA